MPPNPARPGWTTTEFWVTTVKLVMAQAATAIALIHPGFHISPGVQAAAISAAQLAAAIAVGVYTYSRSHVKSAAIAAGLGQLVNDIETDVTAADAGPYVTATPPPTDPALNWTPAPDPGPLAQSFDVNDLVNEDGTIK